MHFFKFNFVYAFYLSRYAVGLDLTLSVYAFEFVYAFDFFI